MLILFEVSVSILLYANNLHITALWVLIAIECIFPPGILLLLVYHTIGKLVIQDMVKAEHEAFRAGFNSGVKNGLQLGFGKSLQSLRALQMQCYKELGEESEHTNSDIRLRNKTIYASLDGCIDTVSDLSRRYIKFVVDDLEKEEKNAK